MKLHRLLVLAVTGALLEIFREGKPADKVIERLLKSNPRWGSRDRAFVAEQVYEIVRWRRLLWRLADFDDKENNPDVKKLTTLVGVNLALKNESLPDWEEFAGISADAVSEKKKLLGKERKITQSVPDWLDKLGASELGERWDSELAALNRPAAVVLRTNTLKTSKLILKELLSKQGWETTETSLAPDALVLKKRGNIFLTDLFRQGLFEVQDAGSQCIAPFLQAEPGMRVVDACAGAGGKSLHLASLLQNKGSIIALDTEEWKLAELRRRAKRDGVQIIQTRLIDSSKIIKRLHNSADRLLLDVPCSGLGVLRRNPDAKWKLTPEFIENVKVVQLKILTEYSRILRPAGLMVYATCSILPSENERQVERFLSFNPAFRLLDERKISPATEGFDGFYMALMQRT